MGIFQTDPKDCVKTISKLLIKHRSSYEFPIECRSTAKMAVNEMALNKFSGDMSAYNYLQQSTVFLDDEYWDEIVKKVISSTAPKAEIKINPKKNTKKLTGEHWLVIIIAVIGVITLLKNPQGSEVTAPAHLTTISESNITNQYSVYTGKAGIYESPFVMYLKNNNGQYEGQYIYTRHQKWIDLLGTKDKNGYIALKESYQGKPTGTILIKENGFNLDGKGFWRENDIDGESFSAILRGKIDEVEANARDGRYTRKHSIAVLNGTHFEDMDTADELVIQHFSDLGFTFYLYEVTTNGHHGTLTGSAIYSDNKALFLTNEGCELNFSFNEKNSSIEYIANPLPATPNACSKFGGARNVLSHNEFTKKM